MDVTPSRTNPSPTPLTARRVSWFGVERPVSGGTVFLTPETTGELPVVLPVHVPQHLRG